MNADTIIAAVGAAVGVGVPVSTGLLFMFKRIVILGVEMGHVKTQLNGHLKYHERMSETFIKKISEENDFEENHD